MKIIGNAILAIGDRMTVTVYAIKYWLLGEKWEDARNAAEDLVINLWR
jgi:hypothetical protein